MNGNDLGITLILAVSGVIALFTDHVAVGVFLLILAALMVGVAIGRDPTNFDK